LAAVIFIIAGSVVLLAWPPPAARARPRTRAPAGPIYRSHSYSPAERAADLVARMTTSEKASQMVSGQSPPIPRLGVHSYGWWNESQHGVSYLQLSPTGSTTPLVDTTSYPVNLSLGSTWDPGLMYREATAISDEAREIAPGNVFNLDYFAPTINLSRDPRWGRNDETFSEDPALTAAIASQYVNGMEGKDQQGRLLPQAGGYLKTIATLKHYAANNSEVNRLGGTADVDERTLREYYTDAFRLIIEHSHPGALMAALNSVDGIPASANEHLLDTLARQTFGFGGYVASDCDAISTIVAYHRWRPPGWTRPLNNTEAHAFANAAGDDLNCTAGTGDVLNSRTLLPAAISEGIRTQSDVYNAGDLDNSLLRLFTARMQTGEFDRLAAEPWVRAARARVRPGSWVDSDANHAVTETPARLELAHEVADRSLVLLKNAPINRRDGSVGPVLPLRVPRSGQFRVAVIGALANSGGMYLGGYSSVQGPAGVANEVNPYAGIKRAIQAINPSAVVDFYNGFTGGGAAAGLVNIDPSAVAAAAGYDDVIVYAGTDRSTAGEDADRPSLTLPGAQAQLISDVAAVNPNTVAVMETIGPVELGGFESQVPAIVWSSYNGQRKGDALADVLLGRYDPSGHLPFTWYQSTSDLPAITDYRIRPATGYPGRTYMYYQGPVSYPFGYGLSYTTFRASNLQLSHPAADANDTVHVSLQVTNTGTVSGKDLVQLYVTPPRSAAWLQPPIKRLAAFRQVSLAPGQTRTLTLSLRVADFALFNPRSGRYTVFDGRYGIQISSSAANADVELGAWLSVHGKLLTIPSVVTAKPAMPGDAARGIQARVMFPEDEVVLPQLTVAMNDDSLYGSLGPRHVRPLPRGARVRYSSDGPGVVSVDKRGLIRTLRDGVATITATVSYNGTSRSTQFVVRVLSELDRLSVDGTPLPTFQPDSYDYDVIVPKFRKPRKPPKRKKGHKRRLQPKLPAIPRVTVSTPDRSARIRIAQARALPGIARVTITGRDGITQTYSVHFARPAGSDEFSGPRLEPAWSWLRPDPATAHFVSGSLVLGAQPGDLTTHTARNVLLQPALGDWAIETRMTLNLPPHADTQQAGIIAYQDDGDYLKLDWEYRSGAPRLTETSTDSLSGAPVGQILASLPTAGRIGTSVWLRMVKRGPRYTTYYSADGVHFAQLYSVGASLSDVKVGLFALSGASTLNDLSAAFDYFRLSQSGLTLGSTGSLSKASLASIR
jgi:beta-glucosidase